MIIENPERRSHTHVCDRCGNRNEMEGTKCQCKFSTYSLEPYFIEPPDPNKLLDIKDYTGWICNQCGWDTNMVDDKTLLEKNK